uniref:G_PROTEIN_RECEP_F1_2 domain-containing protein n=1 Tax=Heligmosomoides polygyrus TaxID=6339 RepID=A0A8L8JIW5_HELPZ
LIKVIINLSSIFTSYRLGLAVSDLMFLLLCVPFTAIDYALPVWIFPEWTCSMINFFQHISAYCSVWTLTLMALDRYLAVVYPVDSLTLRSPKNTIIALVVVYTIIVATQIPVGLMHGIYTYDFIIEERSTCAIVSIATNNATLVFARTYFITFNVFGYILPLGISVVLYWRMLRRLWDTPRPGHSNAINGSIRSRPETRRAKRKVTRLVLCVLVIWAVCWLPLNVCFFVSGLSYPETLVMKGGVIMVIVQISSQVLAYTNSCLNPILYALMSENFRKGFIRVICIIGRKLTMNNYCIESDKQLRMEFTTCNNTAMSNSIRRFQPTPKTGGKVRFRLPLFSKAI